MTMTMTVAMSMPAHAAYHSRWAAPCTTRPSDASHTADEARSARSLALTSGLVGAQLSEEARCLTNNRDPAHVALKVMLSLDTSVLREAAGVRRRLVITGQTNVLVVADALFGQAIEDFLLPVSKALHPFLHVLHHLSLDLRVGVMEVGVKPESQ